jgi:hypothetical protein
MLLTCALLAYTGPTSGPDVKALIRMFRFSFYDDKDYRTAPFERCVFCGSVGDEGLLTDEHAIPRALGGRLVLRNGTCASCREITSRFESKCLNSMFVAVRAHHQYKASTSKKRRGKLPIKIVKPDQSEQVVMIPVRQYPVTLFLPDFSPPTLDLNTVVELKVTRIKNWGIVTDYQDRIAALQKLTNSRILKVPCRMEPRAFGRMLAKIAHCLAIGKVGPDRFTPLLTNIILKDDGPISGFIGGAPYSLSLPDGPRPYHQFQLVTGAHPKFSNPLLVCLLKLFAFAVDPPTYQIVVGETDSTLRQILLRPSWPC